MDNAAELLNRDRQMPWTGLIFDLRQWIEREQPQILTDRNVVRLYETVKQAIDEGRDIPLYAVADCLDYFKIVPQQHGAHWVLVFDREAWRRWTGE